MISSMTTFYEKICISIDDFFNLYEKNMKSKGEEKI